MKKTIVMAAILGAMGFAGAASAAGDASHVFTWSGTVPAIGTEDGFIIKSAAGTDIDNGLLLFVTDASGKGVLQSATSLDFNVFDYSTAPTIGAPAKSYSYELTSLAATKGGLVQEQDSNGYYAINADGAVMVKGGAATPKATGGKTVLTVQPSAVATPSNQPAAGDDVAVHATIVVTNATM